MRKRPGASYERISAHGPCGGRVYVHDDAPASLRRDGGVSDSSVLDNSLSDNSQILYGICGVIWVNAANPLTGERREIQLRAGQKLTVFLSDQEGEQSIELKIENVSENDLPDKLLRLYADNEAMLQHSMHGIQTSVHRYLSP